MAQTAPAITTPRAPSATGVSTSPVAGALALAEAPIVAIAEAIPETVPDAAPEPQLRAPVSDERETEAETDPPGTTQTDISAEQLRDAVVSALMDAQGQQSAAHMLADSAWSRSESEWRVAVPVSEKMLAISANADVRRIAESIVRNGSYAPKKISFTASGAAARPVTSTNTGKLRSRRGAPGRKR